LKDYNFLKRKENRVWSKIVKLCTERRRNGYDRSGRPLRSSDGTLRRDVGEKDPGIKNLYKILRSLGDMALGSMRPKSERKIIGEEYLKRVFVPAKNAYFYRHKQPDGTLYEVRAPDPKDVATAERDRTEGSPCPLCGYKTADIPKHLSKKHGARGRAFAEANGISLPPKG